MKIIPEQQTQKLEALPERILSAIQGVVPRKAVLHEPSFAGNEWAAVKECLDTGWVSSAGKYVDLFEKKLCELTGSSYSAATVNGTAALHICLKLAGVKAGDEVLMPALTFVATANAAAYENAVPHFVDSDIKSMGVDPTALAAHLKEGTLLKGGQCVNRRTGRPITALVAVHAFGHPADIDPLIALCREYKIELIEDAAESLGSLYKEKHAGTRARLAALSFNGNKIITTGGGGALLIQDEALAKKAKHITTTAKVAHPWKYEHDEVGYNYRLPNINAALGVAQLEQLGTFVRQKRALADRYRKAFEGMNGVRFFTEADYAKSNYWLNVLLLDAASARMRDAVLEKTNAAGLMTRPAWTLLHRLPMFSQCPRADLIQSEMIEARLINIPSSAKLAGAL